MFEDVGPNFSLIKKLNINEDQMSDRTETRNHNLEFIKSNLGFSQIKNSAVFQNGEKFFFSPAVSEGKHGKYWIDIREANLEKVVIKKSFLMPRIVPDLFLIERLHGLKKLLAQDLMEYRPNSGNVWGIYMKLNIPEMDATLVSKKDPSVKINTKLIHKRNIIKVFERIGK